MCNHNQGDAITWGVANSKRCTVFCLRCRVVFARYVSNLEARQFVSDYRDAASRID